MLLAITNPALRQAAKLVATTIGLTAVSVATQLTMARLLQPEPQVATPGQMTTALKISLATSIMQVRGVTFEQAVADPAFLAACQAMEQAVASPTIRHASPAPAPVAQAA